MTEDERLTPGGDLPGMRGKKRKGKQTDSIEPQALENADHPAPDRQQPRARARRAGGGGASRQARETGSETAGAGRERTNCEGVDGGKGEEDANEVTWMDAYHVIFYSMR